MAWIQRKSRCSKQRVDTARRRRSLHAVPLRISPERTVNIAQSGPLGRGDANHRTLYAGSSWTPASLPPRVRTRLQLVLEATAQNGDKGRQDPEPSTAAAT